jgi:hypothetical protein
MCQHPVHEKLIAAQLVRNSRTFRGMRRILPFSRTEFYPESDELTPHIFMRFQVLTAASMKLAAFWDVAPCSVVGTDDVSEVITVFVIRTIEISYWKRTAC